MATERPIGTRIRRARERKRWTQQQLAAQLGVSRTTVDSWENDRAYPRSSVGALEEVLGISLSDDDGRAKIIPPQMRKFIRETLDDPEDQRRVIGLLEGTLTWPAGPPAEQEQGESHPRAV